MNVEALITLEDIDPKKALKVTMKIMKVLAQAKGQKMELDYKFRRLDIVVLANNPSHTAMAAVRVK